MLNCEHCGHEIDAISHLCPECGRATFTYEGSGGIIFGGSAHIMAELGAQGEIVGFRESGRDGRVAAADLDANNRASMSLTGTPPQNEEDTTFACGMLIQTLNAQGENWSEPETGTHDADCLASDKGDRTKELRVQVVRAVSCVAMRELAREGRVSERDVSIDNLTSTMAAAIRAKINHYSPGDRRSLVLAVDANRFPVLTLDPVVNEFRRRYGKALIGEFQSIWIVGPSQSRTKRLDVDES